MKAYILLEDFYQGWFYCRVETKCLIPIAKQVVNADYAQYVPVDYTIKKITSFENKTKNIKKITTSRIYTFRVGESYGNESPILLYMFKTFKGLLAKYRNMFLIPIPNKNGCVSTYHGDGHLQLKEFLKNGVKYKEIWDDRYDICKHNLKKNKTTIINKVSATIQTFPSIVWVSPNNPNQVMCKKIYRNCNVVGDFYYSDNRRLQRKKSFKNNKLQGIIIIDTTDFYYKNKHKSGVYWSGRYVSKNLQTWYQTPLNFIFRKNNKIKCF
jgi:hypothetical protein